MPVNWYFFSKSLIFSRSSENFFLLITTTGLAIVLDSSDMATPIVLVPRSKPTSGPLLFMQSRNFCTFCVTEIFIINYQSL